MFIYHFNRLIHNRLLWIVFAVIVAFAFLSVDCTSGSGGGRRAAGKLGKRDVDAERFAFAERFAGGGRNRAADVPPALVETQTWRHLAALHTARRMGVARSDPHRLTAIESLSPVLRGEISQAIREVPAFSNQGQFDARLYRQALAQSLGVTPAAYEGLMAEQIALAKLSRAVATAALASPMELEDEVSAWTDQFTIQYATISNRPAASDAAVDDQAVRAYYQAHRETFAQPDRVGVHYAALPVSNFFAAVAIPEEDIEEFYDSNASRFTQTSTNDTLVTRKLEEVRGEILAELTRDEARYVAGTNAAAYMDTLGMDDLRQFTWRSQARGMTVATSPLFAADGYVPGIEMEAQEEFRNAAFDLDPRRLDARHAIVSGKDWVYLLMAWTNHPAYTPDFDDVKDRVKPLALAEARERAFQEQCGRLRSAIQSAMDNGQTFGQAAATQALGVSTAITFVVQAAGRFAFPNAQAVIPAAMRLRPGTLSDPVSVPDGALLIHVAERKTGDTLASEMVRSQIRDAILRRRESTIVEDWMRWNLDRVGFTPARAADTFAADEADDGEGDEPAGD